MRPTPPCLWILALAFSLAADTARGQERPLTTQDPEPIPAGRVRAQAGVDWLHDEEFPISGLRGELVRLPYLELAFGLGSVAEFQLASGFNVFFVDEARPAPLSGDLDFTDDTTTDIEDPVVATKIRLQRETDRAPAVALRVATRLPSASNESGLGNDTIDWFLALLAAKSIGPARLVGNFGMGVLSIPTQGDRQNDVLTYGFSVTRAATSSLTFLGQVNGRVDIKGETPPGTEDRGQALLGVRWTLGALRLDAGVLTGIHSADPDLGATVGVTWETARFSSP